VLLIAGGWGGGGVTGSWRVKIKGSWWTVSQVVGCKSQEINKLYNSMLMHPPYPPPPHICIEAMGFFLALCLRGFAARPLPILCRFRQEVRDAQSMQLLPNPVFLGIDAGVRLASFDGLRSFSTLDRRTWVGTPPTLCR